MGCCCAKEKVNPQAAAATGEAARARHPLSKHNNPKDLTILDTPAHVPHADYTFINSQGLAISVQRWLPGKQPGAAGEAANGGAADGSKSEESKTQGSLPPVKACIVGLHGLNTHLGYTFADIHYRYPASMLAYYNEAGYAFYGIDHQGHGKSEGLKPRTEHGHVGYVRSFDDVANDIWTLVEDVIQKEYPDVPVIIHGHCMGGAHAMRTLQLRPAARRPKNFVGCILSAPSYMIPPEAKPSIVIVKALGCLACCVPRVVVADWPDRNDSSLDTRFYNDRFCTPTPFSAHYAHQLNQLYSKLEHAHAALDVPLLFTQGAEDTYVRPHDTEALFDAAPSRCKTLINIRDMNHGLLHEAGCQKLFVHVIKWVNELVAAREPDAPPLPARRVQTITARGSSDRAARTFQRVGSFLSWRRSSRNVMASAEVAEAHKAKSRRSLDGGGHGTGAAQA